MKQVRAQLTTAARGSAPRHSAVLLQPGEKSLYTIRRSRSFASIAQTLLFDTFILLIVFLLTRLSSRILVESYIQPNRIFDAANLITLNLFLGVIPFFALFALLYQLVTSFSLELTLTDRRIYGRVFGMWGPRAIEFRLYQVERLYTWMGHLCLQSGAHRLVIGGFDDVDRFIEMFRSAAPTVRTPRHLAARSTTP